MSSEVLVVEPSERTLVVNLRADGVDFKLKTPAAGSIRPGDHLQVQFDTASFYLFDPQTGLALRNAARPATSEAVNAVET